MKPWMQFTQPWECAWEARMKNKTVNTPDNSIKEILALAEKNKLDIEEVAISEITENYLETIRTKKADTDELTEFLVSAVKLLSLKIKSLLPGPTEEDWEEEESQLAQQLANHLLEYKTFKEAADLFKVRLEGDQKTYIRNNALTDYVGSLHSSTSLEGLGLGDLLNALEKVLQRDSHRKTLEAFEVPRQEFKVADKIQEISLAVANSGSAGIEFGKLFSEEAQKGEIIATFLALLELIRLQKVKIIQKSAFGSIYIFDMPKSTTQVQM